MFQTAKIRKIFETAKYNSRGARELILSHLFRQPTVGFGGGEEGFFGGEGFVIDAAGDDALGGAAGAADMHQSPSGHVVGEFFAYQSQVAINDLEVTDTQVGSFDAHHRAGTVDGLTEGVEAQDVATPQVVGSQRGEESGGAVDRAQPLLHDGQHTVAHRHARQQQYGIGHRATLRGEDYGCAAHQADEAVVGGGPAFEHRLRSPFEQFPQPAAVCQLLPRNKLRSRTTLGLIAVRRPRNHLSVAEVEGHPAPFQAAIDKQPHGFLSRHNVVSYFCY